MSPGTWVLLAAVVAALALGGYRAWTDGRFRGTHRVRDTGPDRSLPEGSGPIPAPADSQTAWSQVSSALPGIGLGEQATLVQFSSAFCAPCRSTRRVLSDIAAVRPGVVHLEIDAEQHLPVVRALGILRTPTTLVLDASGREATRATGAPRPEQVMAALAALG